MQYLKDEVRQRILTAAQDEFYTQGFTEASIRVIAKNAGISSGNVYRYFPSKALIFDELVGSVYHQFLKDLASIEQAQQQKTIVEPSDCKSCMENLDRAILNLYAANRMAILLLLFKSQGSDYGNVKDELHRLVKSTLMKSMPFQHLPNLTAESQSIMAGALAASLIESTCFLLANSNDQTPTTELLGEIVMVQSLGLQYYFSNVKS